jgi:putative DNA primase/helicase
VFADNDTNFAGHAAAYTLAHRLALAGIKVYVEFPVDIDGAPDSNDWNDVLIRSQAVKQQRA